MTYLQIPQIFLIVIVTIASLFILGGILCYFDKKKDKTIPDICPCKQCTLDITDRVMVFLILINLTLIIIAIQFNNDKINAKFIENAKAQSYFNHLH